LYEIESMRRFAGLKLNKAIPDETTILNFRHFLDANAQKSCCKHKKRGAQ